MTTPMTKEALREEFRYMQEHYSDPSDRPRQVIYIAAEALLDELEAKDKRIAEMERDETKLIVERDSTEDALSRMYEVAVGESPEWSNMFDSEDAIEVVDRTFRALQSRAESAEQKVAMQSGIILSAKKFISEYAGLGDVGAYEFLEILDKATGITLQIQGGE